MRVFRPAVVAVTALVTVIGLAGPAAAAPANDTFASATAVTSLPFTDTVDTSTATRDADDDALAAQCLGVPAWDATVWYSVTATTNGGLMADSTGSDYAVGFFVATGSPGNFQLQGCGPGTVGWATTAGETYYLVAFDDQEDGGGNGGSLNLTIDEIPAPPTIDFTVNPRGTFNARTGEATISGTVTCSGVADFAFLEAQLTQSVGRFKVVGFGFTDVTCDGETRPYSLLISGDNGTFAGGKAASLTFALACGPFFCNESFAEFTVQLTGKKR